MKLLGVYEKVLNRHQVEERLFVRPQDSDPNAVNEFDMSGDGVNVPLDLGKTPVEGHLHNLYAKLNNVDLAQQLLAQKIKGMQEAINYLSSQAGKRPGVSF